MKSSLVTFAFLSLAVLLTQCVGPDGRPMSPFGPMPPRPYSDQREQYRSDVRDYSQEENQRASERGQEDGRLDYQAGEQKSYLRHYRNFTEATRAAYQYGYDQGYGSGPLPGSSDRGATDYRSQPDPAYNQGYDYGLRDRLGGRPSDPEAYGGSYDPRFRRSFERGYADAYESGRSR